MLRVLLADARSGMVLACPVFHPRDPGMVLLRPGVELDDQLIERMRDLGCVDAWIKAPALAFIAEHYHPAILSAQAEVTRCLLGPFDQIAQRSGMGLDFSGVERAVGGLLDALVLRPRAAMFVRDIADKDHEELRHAVSVGTLCLLLGLQLEGYVVSQRRRLTASAARGMRWLGLGGLLHDVGMLRVSSATRERWKKTRDTNDSEWQRHVLIGYDLLRSRVSPIAAGVALHHHQRFDGTGFPMRLGSDGSAHAVAGEEIHIFARIAAVADTFDRLRQPGLRGGGLTSVAALRAMIERAERGEFDPRVVHGLVRCTPAFAPGTAVVLSDGREGVVCGLSVDEPCKPTVAVVDWRAATKSGAGAAGMDEPELVDLARESRVRIDKAEGVSVRGSTFAGARVRRLVEGVAESAA